MMVRVLTQPEPGWQRIDDSDRNIIYEGQNWLNEISKYSDNYLKTFHFKESSHPSNLVQIKFSFVGTKLRIIGLANNGGYDSYATIIIDGNPERLDYYAWEGKRQAVIYEKINLNKGPHTVTIRGIYLNLDAIDIDSDGYVFTPKKVGEILDKPDPGWNRFDDADSLIKYGDGSWNRSTDDRYYNSTVVYSVTKSIVEFSFKGTGVRLVSQSVNLGYGPVDITIDGAKESYNPVLGSDNWKVLLYNKEGLKNEVHSVKLEGLEGIIMDTIDILDGELVKTAKVGDVLLQPETGWKRIDDTDVNIKYTGNWKLIDNLPDYHNSTARFKHAKQSSVDNSAMSATFKFNGTKLRVIGVSNNTYDRDAQIIIDGKPETISFYADRDVSPTRVLLFDKQGLTDEIHTVELKGVFMHLDAIDIDETGSMVPPTKVGDVLLQPESGWTRFDDRHSLIKYGSGTWELATDSRYYDSTNTFSRVSCDIEFSFKGTGLRIVSKMITTTSGYGPVDVLIDGVTESYSITGSSDQWQTLLYEKQGLPDAVHSVKLVAPNGIIMDAIDVLGGELVKPPAKIGDQLPQPESGWKRYKHQDENFVYAGVWGLSAGSAEELFHYANPNKSEYSVEFMFVGKSLRIICPNRLIHNDSMVISIDGNEETYSLRGTDRNFVLVYEQQNLEVKTHTVVIKSAKPDIVSFWGIDIDSEGYLMKTAKVGDVLKQPEPGWKRIDDTDNSFKYVGDWWKAGITTPEWFNNTFHYVDGGSGEVQYQFSGTKLRVIGCVHEAQHRSNDIKIIIDGKEEVYSEQANKVGYQTLVYEKLGLAEGVHNVVIKSGTNSPFPLTFDAIDIDQAGSVGKLPSKVGDQLLQPEVGWKRIEDSNSNFKYTGDGWATHSDAKWSGGSTHYCPNSDKLATVEFVFNGTKLRIIGLLSAGYREGQIWIDEQPVETINFEQPNAQYQSLVYEKLGLANCEHKVKLSGLNINFDAIDIDSDGSIEKPPAKVGDQLLQPEPGWKRMDDADSNIRYEGKWNFITTQKGAYNETLHYYSAPSGSTEEVSATFNFKGTKLRLVALSSYFQKKAILKIDGVSYDLTKVEGRSPIGGVQQTLMFEATGLEDKEHLVELSGIDITLDAIDIDKTGSLVKPKPPAKVGDILLQPEPGWTRVDDTNPLIHYRGDYWSRAIGESASGPTYNVTSTYRVPDYADKTVATVEFSFKGTGIRVISSMYDNDSWSDVSIEIDGLTQSYKANGPKREFQVLMYDRNLPDGIHKVKLSGTQCTFDAFDIKRGELVGTPTNPRDVLFEPEPGWKRFDDTDSNIQYTGVWAAGPDGRCYNDTIHYKNSISNTPPDANPVSIKFNFEGTKLRIIGLSGSAYDSNAKILIDGVEESIDFSRTSAVYPIYQSLIYEKLGLSNKMHTVEIKGEFINLDAIDIDESGSIGGKSSVKIGDQLKQPEAGWKRLDGNDPLLKYQGTWEKGSSSDWYNGTYHYVKENDSKGAVEFDFYGTQLRIITRFDVASYRSADISITIDGVTEKYSEVALAIVNQGLAYEKLGLNKGKHRVRIQCGTKGTYRLNIDAIDIDADGYIEKPPITVGDFLATPGDGWKRFTKENMYFDYTGGMDYQNQTPPINYSFDKIQFRFFGTKFRLIYSSNLGSNEEQLGHVLIDGVKYPVNMFPVSGPAKIACEVLNLDEGYHVVTVNGGTHEGWDPQFIGIDIDATGHIDRLPVSIGDISTYPNYGWKRYDDNATYIQYDANWSKSVAYNGAYGGKSTCAKKDKNASMVFRFKGTKLRLIVGCATNQYYSDRIRVKIDDLPEEYFDAIAPQDTNQVLKYEKLGLEDVEHDVTITVITTQPGAAEYDFRMDAIDIDDTGSLVSRPGVGTVLTEPEKGWKRISDTDPLIRYIGNWKTAIGNVDHYNKTTHYNLDKKLDTSFEFEFVGTKLRLLAYGDSGYDATSKVLIDGKEETMVYNSPSGNQVIRYEKIGLDRGKHTVKVIGKAMSLDSIDIDADGYLLARLGDKLVEPEPGWVRFDDTHKNIEYNGFWKTTEADVSCYNNTHHWKSKEDNNDSTISAGFLFKGTKFRLISMTSPSYPEDIELKIDGQKEILKLSGEDMQYQTLAYEKKNLEDMIHVIELSGKYISIDAIDLEEGATLLKLPDEKLKPYQIRNGLIFKDDFDTFDSRWIASPVGSYSLIDRKGNFRMLHNVSRDTLLLADLPNEKEFAFEVSADYTPTHEDDKGGIIVWRNGEENIEFLETEDGTRETTELKWMACKDNEDWTFFSDYGEGFNFYDSDRMNCSKFGVVLKKGSNSKFINLDIDSIIATRGRKLTIANIAPNINVQMEDESGRIIFNGNTGYNTGIQITLPSLEFTGKVILTNVEGKELGVIKTTFYGGDVYGFGSNLEIKFSGEELSTLAQTRLPDMISGKSEIMLELVNPSVARANNVNLSIAQYEDKFGWSWADLALDSNGKPGQYQDSINIPYVNPEKTIKFWLKVTKGTDYVGLAPLQFQIHLEHE
ncbi:hypothetical protein NPX88_13250 [Bacillus mycoides]|nr:hypothetical protein [Bacillus mycoides]MCQ6566726.1 hypothetical protein [Bacillus mycoides]